jgi:hypothetical protein
MAFEASGEIARAREASVGEIARASEASGEIARAREGPSCVINLNI